MNWLAAVRMQHEMQAACHELARLGMPLPFICTSCHRVTHLMCRQCQRPFCRACGLHQCGNDDYAEALRTRMMRLPVPA